MHVNGSTTVMYEWVKSKINLLVINFNHEFQLVRTLDQLIITSLITCMSIKGEVHSFLVPAIFDAILYRFEAASMTVSLVVQILIYFLSIYCWLFPYIIYCFYCSIHKAVKSVQRSPVNDVNYVRQAGRVSNWPKTQTTYAVRLKFPAIAVIRYSCVYIYMSATSLIL